MNTIDWQSPAALTVVAATAVLLAIRFLRRRRRFRAGDRTPCGKGCDCPAKPAPKTGRNAG